MATSPARKKAALPPKKPATSKEVSAGSVTPKTKPKPKAPPPKPKPSKSVKTSPAEPRTQAKRSPPPSKAPKEGPQTITPKQQRFVDEYLIDLNGKQAAIRAGYSTTNADSIAYQLLHKTPVMEAIEAGRKQQQERTKITADRVLREIASVALADARELVEVKTGCCRHCYGEGFKYQRSVGEMNHDREQWLDKGNDPAAFDEKGGIGYDPRKAPNCDCPNCGGDGYPRTVLKDTRNLSPGALALYAGAKQTKEGIEIKMHSKMDALEKLAKHLGMYEKDNQQRVDPLASLLHAIAGGNSNGFVPQAVDPEKPEPEAKPTAFMPKAKPGAEDWRD